MHVDVAAGRHVADGVVDEVGRERRERAGVAVDPERFEALGAEIDVLRGGEARVLGHDVARDGREVDVRVRRGLRRVVLAGEREQLLDDARRAPEAAAQRVQRGGALGLAPGALGELGLQVHRRERRAQLVRGVGDERLLRVERRVDRAAR